MSGNTHGTNRVHYKKASNSTAAVDLPKNNHGAFIKSSIYLETTFRTNMKVRPHEHNIVIAGFALSIIA